MMHPPVTVEHWVSMLTHHFSNQKEFAMPCPKVRRVPLFLIVAALLQFGPFALMSRSGDSHPNILILFTDDQRADTIAALGNPDIHTPTLDELAQRGCNASATYCLGANIGAVCRPSRNMLLSGRTYFRWTNPQDGRKPQQNAPALPSTLPAVFKAAGYETYHHGKRGNTAQLIHRQFDHSHYLDDFADRWSLRAGEKVVDDAIAFLKDRSAKASPWLMYLAFAMPHDPRAASDQALAFYDPSSLTLPKNHREAHPFDNGASIVRDEWTAIWPRTETVLRDQWHDYYAAITTLDENIGRLVRKLKDDGVYEDTIIVFSSDHGLAMGSHGLMGKQNVYEAGFKAPMVLAGPGIMHRTADDPVYLMDLFPTLCELAGVRTPDGLDGKSFAAMVTGDSPGPRDAVLLSYTDTQRAVRYDGWKLIRYPKINRNQLFHLEVDPDEINDLAGDVRYSAKIELLARKMRQLQAEQGDDLPLESESPSDPQFEPPYPAPAVARHRGVIAQSTESGALRVTRIAGPSSDPVGKPFSIRPSAGGSITAVAVGVSREPPVVVTGLRVDLLGPRGGDTSRRTLIVGDPESRWMPLLDQLRNARKPIGLHGTRGEVIERLGFFMADGSIVPAFGGSIEAESFDIRIGAEGASAKTLAQAFDGFTGTVSTWHGRTVIESIGLIYRSIE